MQAKLLIGEMRQSPSFYVSFSVIVFVMLMSTSCRSIFSLYVDTSDKSAQAVGAPGISNREYVNRLIADGWPAEILNTAAGAGYLDDDEKNLILAHNLVRYDPKRFAELYVTEYISYFRGNEFHYPDLDKILITYEGAEPAQRLYRELINTRPMGLLIPSPGLSLAARSHINYLVQNLTRGHDGQGGLIARVEHYGRWDVKLGENISYGNFSAHDALLYMLIDDKVPDRSHRRIILTPDFRFAGIAKAKHPAFPTGFSYVINYAHHFEEYR